VSVTCIVQARMGSTRLPGKVLVELGGEPLLAFLLRRLAPLAPDALVVATTDTGADDPVADLARARDVEVVRGSERDVLSRFVLALDRFPADTVVRITADCPLVDPAVVRGALALRAATGADYVSNTLVRTYPDGLDTEVIDAEVLRIAGAEAVDPVEREHVTPFVYRRPERFGLRTFRHRTVLSDQRWTVDTAEDVERVRRLVDRMDGVDFGWEELAALVDPTAPPTDGFSFLPAAASDADAILALRNDPDAVRFSRSARPVAPDEHAHWFASTLEHPGTRIWVARQDGQVVGQVRVDVRTGVGTISFGVAAGSRGRGIGTRLLLLLLDALAADEQTHTLVGEVDERNDASLRAFERAGFSPADRSDGFVVMRWERRHLPWPPPP
jgi:spore coat polysaccharide biosynthesis protein SpsF